LRLCAQMKSSRPQLAAAPDLRIVEIDVLRGIALIGIYWINIVIFALPHGAYSYPHLLGTADNLNIPMWAFSEVFVEGTMRALFSILFGASTLIFLDEAKLSSQNGILVVDRYYRRCLTLMIFGLIHAYILLSQWELLYAYGLLGMFLFPLRNMKSRTLVAVALALFIISDYNTLSENYQSLEGNEHLRSMSVPDRVQYRNKIRATNTEEMQQEIPIYRSGYLEIFSAQAPVVSAQQSTKMYSDHFFDIGGMMLIGMALMKMGALTGKRSMQFYLLLALGGYTVGGFLHSVEAYQLWLNDFNPESRDPWLFMPYNIARLAMTLGHIGLFGILLRVGWITRMAGFFAPLGKMALSNYVGQSLISAFVFYGFGLGYFAYLERYQLTFVFLAVILVQIVASTAWLQHFRYGPLEWLWRSIIYGTPQPLVKPSAQPNSTSHPTMA
jgi:uncharacterized protein